MLGVVSVVMLRLRVSVWWWEIVVVMIWFLLKCFEDGGFGCWLGGMGWKEGGKLVYGVV